MRGKLRSFRIAGLTVCGALAACACSSDATPNTPGGASGSAATAGSGSGVAGAPAGGSSPMGVAGSVSGSGTDIAGAPAGGSPDAGGGPGAGGSAGSGMSAGGASGGSTAGGSTGGGSTGGGSTGGGSTGGGSAGGAGPCVGAGHAVSLSANGTGSAADGAKARVEFQLGSDLPTGNTNRTLEVWAYMKQSDWTGQHQHAVLLRHEHA